MSDSVTVHTLTVESHEPDTSKGAEATTDDEAAKQLTASSWATKEQTVRPESKAYAYKWLSHDPSTANRPRPLNHAMTNQETFSYESDNGRTRFEVKVHTMKNEEGGRRGGAQWMCDGRHRCRRCLPTTTTIPTAITIQATASCRS